ncbi:hypothetical protein ACFVXG_07005 [Kitasatospora sp. NPDC058162]|uniref:hypothetical protein n=1 Tax=Kitasatospora sp. NPDC058162 TaxID=3346362 RepID=UPI0036D7B764
MTKRWKVAGAIVLSLVVAVSVGAVLFVNGYGPLALADRSGRVGTGTAKHRIDAALRATMDGISPSLTYAGADFEVDREHHLWDGEPSMASDVTEIIRARTVVSRVKLPALMDQVTQVWHALGSRVVERNEELHSLQGVGSVGGEIYLTFYAYETQDPSSYTVMLRAEAGGVLYQPAHEYEPLSPLGRTPRDSRGYVINNLLDDPYWSH